MKLIMINWLTMIDGIDYVDLTIPFESASSPAGVQITAGSRFSECVLTLKILKTINFESHYALQMTVLIVYKFPSQSTQCTALS